VPNRGAFSTSCCAVSTNLERAAVSEQVKQLWTIMTAVLTAVRGGGLEASVALKRLIGQVDRQLKRLIDGGESALVNSPPVELVDSLLYYVARSTSQVRASRRCEQYNLAEVLPGQIEQAREGLSGPSVKLMRTVAQAIKEDLGIVKDALDIFVRTGMQGRDKLSPQLDMLKKIGDTLGVLGLDKARGQIQRETQDLAAIVTNGKAPDQSSLEQIAATLLDVEDALDRELVRAVMPGDDAEPTQAGASASDAQHRQVTQAVMGECTVNLAKVKEAVIQLVENPADTRPLEQVRPQLRGIAAGLLMLDKAKAVTVVERVGNVIGTRLAAGTKLKPEYLERLGDAIVSVEYYLETVSAGRADPWYMLDNADRCLDLLESLPVAKPAAPAAPAPAARPAPPTLKKAAPPPSVMQVEEGRSDPEIVEVFIEEAKEEIASIRRNLPVWADDRTNSEALISTRRSFHTLKGSGRMVGAQLIGEFAWSIENLLNKIINQTLEPTPSMVSFVTEASAALPQLIEQLEIGRPPKIDVQQLMKQAEAFADGDPDAASIAREAPRAAAPVAPAPEPGMDPVLADIFVKEMRGHLGVIRQFLATARPGTGPHSVEEPLYRACHTLLGSARMAGYEPAMKLAAPIAEHLRRYFESGVGMPDKAVDALRAAAAEIDTMADALTAGRPVALRPAVLESLGALAFQSRQPRRRLLQAAADSALAPGPLQRALDPGSRAFSRRKPRRSDSAKPRSRKFGNGGIRQPSRDCSGSCTR
jgi:chemosensory pili system protein ChpA (sensor histidine kinase/response regulator)